MTRTMSATEARVHFGEALRSVMEDQETVVVERSGKAAAVLLPLATYERLVAEHHDRVWRDALGRAALARSLCRTELAGRSLPAPEEVLQELREENDERLAGLR